MVVRVYRVWMDPTRGLDPGCEVWVLVNKGVIVGSRFIMEPRSQPVELEW
jgi:hypothetical protein